MKTLTTYTLVAFLLFAASGSVFSQRSGKSGSKSAKNTTESKSAGKTSGSEEKTSKKTEEKQNTDKAATTKDSTAVAPKAGAVSKKFVPTLEPAERILVLPQLETQTEPKQQMYYSIAESPASLKGEYVPLPAASIREEFPSADQAGYVRLGVGNHRSFLGDAQLNLIRKPKTSLDINYLHRSIFGDVIMPGNNVTNAYNVENNLQANFQGISSRTVLDIALGERFNFWNYYGGTPASGTDSLRSSGGQWSTDGRFVFGLRSNTLENPLSWSFRYEGHLFRLGNGFTSATGQPGGSNGAAEREMKINGSVDYTLNDRFNFGINVTIRNFSYRLPATFASYGSNPASAPDLTSEFENRGYFEMAPYGTFFYKNWRFKGGVKFSIPTLIQESVRPNLFVSAITPVNHNTVFHVTLDGGVLPMSYREGIAANPWLDPAIRIQSAWKVFDINCGMDFRPVSNLRFTPELGICSTNNEAYFNNAGNNNWNRNISEGKLFTVNYMNSTRIRTGLTGEYTVENKLSVLGSLYYNTYSNTSKNGAIDALLFANKRKAWYKPGIEAHLRADVRPVEKLTVFADYQLQALRYAPTTTQFCASLDAMSDLNLGANYKVSREVGIFVHINNLLDQRYEVYKGYPVHGFTALVGGSVSF